MFPDVFNVFVYNLQLLVFEFLDFFLHFNHFITYVEVLTSFFLSLYSYVFFKFITFPVHKREFGSFVTTLSFTYFYDHQATDGSKTGSQNIRGSKVGNSEGCHTRRVS